ncbi:uncharacterized protein AMSG_01000 [Thecamonas trahens ATCC 50062]|uniref:Uncharacterized protein n=1 Tax=Thecamonas trahens ATCC 50062 TaxID=461836 RepID=A0A0L0DII1_THETB|nr:hypothetical protein AMSG_01000 [Thecamonas trahens ATCC 50062]KNC52174.1 hypothetical protein AMSG_01000 [Thecamonas trahens ATCC 50062]|eukprot:XP_013762177.1 hypothetical protein AMSG_01000 [Thecamonas trahens ATCC 50062]
MEVNAYMAHKDKASWFVNDRVHTDGKMYAATPFDPLFLMLAVLERCPSIETSFHRRDQILSCESCPALGRTLGALVADFSPLCERKGKEAVGDDSSLWRLDEARVVAWLKTKVEAVVAAMALVSAAAVSGFRSSSARNKKRKRSDELAGFAVALVSDYVSETWAAKLSEAVTGVTTSGDRAAAAKKAKTSASSGAATDADIAPLEDYSKGFKKSSSTASAASKMTPAQKRLSQTNLKG